MKVIVTKDYEEMSHVAADIVSQVIREKPDAVLGLATGSSPIGLYRNLIAMYDEGRLSFKHISTVNLDEYVGLPASHDQSYAYFMRFNLVDHVDIDIGNTHIPDGCAAAVVDHLQIGLVGIVRSRHAHIAVRPVGGAKVVGRLIQA